MAEHEISIGIPDKSVFHSDVVFVIRADGQKLGELRVSKGTIDWYPKKARNPIALTWEQFDRLMQAQRK